MKRIRSFPKAFLASCFLIGGLMLSSCENPTPVAPKSSGQSTELASAVRDASSLRRVPRKIVAAKGDKHRNSGWGGITVAKWMTVEDGGKLSFGGHSLKVPEEALQQDTLMTMTILKNNFFDVDFGPDGTFNKPVTIRLSYEHADLRGIDEDNLTIAWIDEQTGELIEIKSEVHEDEKVVEGKTDHFTQYTLSTR